MTRVIYKTMIYTAVIAAFLAAITAKPSAAFTAGQWYRLLLDCHSVLKLPEKSSEEKDAKAVKLVDLADRARFMWNDSTGMEGMGGTPFNVEGQMGTEPVHYRPRLIDMYTRWKAAKLVVDPEKQKAYYRDVLLALPVDFVDWPAPYREPTVYALAMDARLNLSDQPEEALQQMAKLSGTGKPDLGRLVAHLKCRDIRMLNDLPIGFPAEEIYTAYTQIVSQLRDRITSSISFAVDPEMKQEREQPYTITGKYDGKIPVVMWAQDQGNKKISEERVVAPGTGFKIALSNINEGESGKASLFWCFQEEYIPEFLKKDFGSDGRQIDGWTADYTYVSFRRTVGFEVSPGNSSVYVTGLDGKNRDSININYTFDHSTESFDWKLIDERGNDVVVATEQKPTGTLSIPKSRLERGTYTLAVCQDPTNPDESVAKSYTPSDFRLSVTGPGVALVIAIDAYLNPRDCLRHACDDAGRVISKLEAAGYRKEDIVYVLGRRKGLGEEEIDTNLPINKTQYYMVTPTVMTMALDTLRTIITRRKPRHIVFFYSGHGQSVSTDNNGDSTADALVAARQPDTEQSEKDIYLNQVFDLVRGLDSSEQKPTFVALVDACRSPSYESKDISRSAGAPKDKSCLLVPVYSCNVGEKSNEASSDKPFDILYDNAQVNNGFFTYSLMTGLDRAASTNLENVLEQAVPVLGQLMTDATFKVQKAKATGFDLAGNVYSDSQTITVGKQALPNVDSIKQLPEEIRNVSLF